MTRRIVKEPPNRGFILQVTVAILLLSVAAAQEARGEEEGGRQKPAWKWSIDERLAARLDLEALAAREAKRKAEQEASRKRWERWGSDLFAEEEAKMTGPPPATESIDGSKTPELFLPLELFTTLIHRGFPAEEAREDLEWLRSKTEERAAALGFGRDLWNRLEKAVAPYLKLLHDEDRRRLLTGAKDYKNEGDGLRICRARAQALEAAKAEFGEEAFLRLLYEAVAPDARRTYILDSWPPDYQRHAEELRFQEEGGCR